MLAGVSVAPVQTRAVELVVVDGEARTARVTAHPFARVRARHHLTVLACSTVQPYVHVHVAERACMMIV